jgi:hypothetical protein
VKHKAFDSKSFDVAWRAGARASTYFTLKELEAIEGEWHKREDCKVEKRSRTCGMCKLFRRLERRLKELTP